MKTVFSDLVSGLLSFSAFAADTACLTAPAKKKLSSATKGSLVRKCVHDQCEAVAAQKELAGAAKNSLTTKCMADGVEP